MPLPRMTAEDLKKNVGLRIKVKDVVTAQANYDTAQKATNKMLSYRDNGAEQFSAEKLENAERLERRMLTGVANACNGLFMAWVAECRPRE